MLVTLGLHVGLGQKYTYLILLKIHSRGTGLFSVPSGFILIYAFLLSDGSNG